MRIRRNALTSQAHSRSIHTPSTLPPFKYTSALPSMATILLTGRNTANQSIGTSRNIDHSIIFPFAARNPIRTISRFALSPFKLQHPSPSLTGLNGFNQRRSIWGLSNPQKPALPSGLYSNLAHMEQTANNNPQSASAQNAFYSALLRSNLPDIVVKRYESGGYATNPACDAFYLRALERVNGAEASVAMSKGAETNDISSILAGKANAGAANANAKSGPNSPVHVVLEQSWGSYLFSWLRFGVWVIALWWVINMLGMLLIDSSGVFRGKMGGSKNSEIKPELQKARFSDVHGCEEAKEELQEIVDFLKSPAKYGTLGGKLPKGVLLVGPPGTGKTLLARAVAGEAGVPFFYMSGSEFDEVYVGVGAKRVRDLFSAARAKAPAIVFIDELDAIGGKRSERDQVYAKQTLNQLLTDLDGFNQTSGVIFLAATNFPQMLDPALMRPGRFDRQVVVGIPDVRGRVAIINHYLKKMQTDPTVDPTVLARGTPGFSGAELENMTNQAAIHASKRRAKVIEMLDFEYAKDRIMMGAERKSAVIQEKDKVMTAYHEGGHALVALFTPHADPLYKATIMPRGHALGITFQLPDIDKVSMAKQEYMAQIDVCMGGKVAEELIYGADATTGGASSDIEKATSIAYTMVTRLGMSPRLGNVDLHSDYARLPAETKQIIWEEVRRLVDEGKTRAEALLISRRKELDRLAKALVDYETLNKEEIEKVITGEKLPNLKASPSAPIKLPEFKVPMVAPPPPPPPATNQD
jgi:ATP-dependent metalloprotease